MKKKLIGIVCLFALTACGGGGGGSSTATQPIDPNFADDPTPASPYPTPGDYNLGQPTGLTESYPSAFWPNNLHNALQIAYGNNSESQIANLTAYVQMNGSICSATPVYYDANNDRTFLIGAAHCFVQNKTSATTVYATNLIQPSSNLKISNGVGPSSWNQTKLIEAVYVRQDYCYNSTFTGVNGDECPNFTPNSGAGTQGNDIAVIQVTGQYADPESYPQLARASQYPTPYTMAPVFSIGYGINTQSPNSSATCQTSTQPCGTMFYTANYQYWQQDATGYHYLYNSFYADASNTTYGASPGTGYTSLVCGGDSGGGDLFWTGSKWILLSEHTYGPNRACGTFYSYLPNGATNVSAYYDWIQSIIKDSTPVMNCKNGTIANCVTNG